MQKDDSLLNLQSIFYKNEINFSKMSQCIKTQGKLTQGNILI